MEEKQVVLNIIYKPVYTVMIMIKNPITSRVHARVNPMIFIFTGFVVSRWFIDGQQILVLSFLRRIVFMGFTLFCSVVVSVIKGLLYNPYRFSEERPFEVS
jgi:hypothetical protein